MRLSSSSVDPLLEILFDLHTSVVAANRVTIGTRFALALRWPNLIMVDIQSADFPRSKDCRLR